MTSGKICGRFSHGRKVRHSKLDSFNLICSSSLIWHWFLNFIPKYKVCHIFICVCAFYKGIWRSKAIVACIFNPCTKWRWVPQPPYPRERDPTVHWIGGCVDCRAGLDALEERKICCRCQESTYDFMVEQPIAWSLYRLCYPSSDISVRCRWKAMAVKHLQVSVTVRNGKLVLLWHLHVSPLRRSYGHHVVIDVRKL